MPLSHIFMPVLVGAERVFAVVDVDRGDLIQTKHFIKVCQHSLIILYDIVTRVVDMTGIQAYPQMFGIVDTVVNCF